jgi:hypothetical protein
MKKIQVTPFINEESLARLEAKSYEKAYTEVPNRVLPADVTKALSSIYKELSGTDFDIEGYTYVARANQGILKGLMAPSVFRAATYETEESEAILGDHLVIRWGNEAFPISLSKEGVSFPNSTAGKKLKIQFKTESTGGKYEDTCLVATLTNSTDKEIYTVVFPIRSVDIKEKLDPDVAEVFIEEGNFEGLLNYIQPLPNPNRKASSGSGELLKGYFVKAASFPLGEYTVTQYRTKTGGKYGPDYFIQVRVPEPFVAKTGVKDDETGEWSEVEVEITDWAIMRPNTALKRILAAQPVITPDSPAKLTVYEHGEYNGHATAKIKLEVSSFEEKEGEIALNF